MPIRVRLANLEDAQDVARLNEVVQALHRDHRPDRFAAADAAAFLPIVEEWLRNAEVAVFVAVDDETSVVLGYVTAIFSSRRSNVLVYGAQVVELDQLAVDPSRRGEGVGTALCEEVLRAAAARRVERIELSTWVFNEPARRLFARLGFEVDFVRMSRATPFA